MANEIIYLTAEGYKKLKEELDHLRSVERPAASAAIAEARDKGDLSENAEYDAAREAQGLLEMRIAKLEDTLANARVIDETKIDKSKVQILSKVTLLNKNNNKQVTYTIVAEHEANLREGKLAIGTPIAKALLGHKKGDSVEVTVPAGVITFEIVDLRPRFCDFRAEWDSIQPDFCWLKRRVKMDAIFAFLDFCIIFASESLADNCPVVGVYPASTYYF